MEAYLVKLKPCPFCGEEVKRVVGFGGLNFFKCKNAKCGAVMSFCNDWFNTHTSEAINQYNKRAEKN